MTRIELTEQEATRLRDVLTLFLGDLRMEIGLTDQLAMRQDLKQTRAFLEDLLRRLRIPEDA